MHDYIWGCFIGVYNGKKSLECTCLSSVTYYHLMIIGPLEMLCKEDMGDSILQIFMYFDNKKKPC